MIFSKKITFLLLSFFIMATATGQTSDTLRTGKKAKQSELKQLTKELAKIQKRADKLIGEIAYLEDSLKVYPIWSKGIFGTVGFNLTSFQNWLSKDEPSTVASTVGFTFNGFFNLEEKKYFWKNSVNFNLNWLKFDNKDIPTDRSSYQVTSDAFNASSLWGYRVAKKFAASGSAEYRTALLEGRWNNPGFLDAGIGGSWTPMKDMVIAIHPLNYNKVFSKDNLNSSLGLKVIGEYARKFPLGINWKTSVSSFFSYRSGELNNWNWTNGLSKDFGNLGIGVDVALKQNRQEAKARELENNPFQYFYIVGLSYNF